MPKTDHSSKPPPTLTINSYIHSCLLQLESHVNQNEKFRDEIFRLFWENSPLEFALCLVSNTRVFRKGKSFRLPIAILEALKEYCKQYDLSHLMTRKQKVEAFDVALEFTTFNIYKLICEIFELQDEKEYVLEMTRHLLSQKRYKEAYHSIATLDLENEFELNDCLFPLFFLGHESWVRAYLTKCPHLQEPFVKILDSFCQSSAYAVYEHLKSLGLENLKPPNGAFDKKWVMKRLPAYVELFNIDLKSCPNLYQTRVGGAMNYLVRKMFVEESIKYEAFEEMVIDLVCEHYNVQKVLLGKLVNLGQYIPAIRIAQQLQIHRADWPDVLRRINEDSAEYFVYKPEPQECDYLSMRMNRSDIILVDKNVQFIDAVNDISENYDVVGIDAEWKPNLGIFKEKTALLQLATWDTIYLIDVMALSHEDTFTSWDYMMERIFDNPLILKLGYGLANDLKVLIKTLFINHWEGYNFPRMLDLRDFFIKLKSSFPELNEKIEKWHPASFVPESESKGLSHACRVVLGKALNKGEQFSNWERRPLRESQIIYAALDSYCLLMIHERLYSFLKEQDLSLEKVLASKKAPPVKASPNEKEKETVKTAPPKAVPISEFKVVVDQSATCVVKFLRLLGADVISLDDESDHMEAVKISHADSRYVITSKTYYKKVIGYIPKAMCYCISPEVSPKIQVMDILKHFNVECKDTDLFSRCMICNGADYIKVDRKELFSHWNKIAGSDAENQVKIGRKMNSVFKCDIMDVDGKLHKDLSVKLAACNAQVPFFLICSKCGKVYWEGSHRSRCTDSMADILDLKIPKGSNL